MVQQETRKRPVWVFDGAVALAAFALSVVALDAVSPGELELFERAPDAWAYVLVAGQTLPLVLRRVRPATVLAIIVVAFVLDRMLDYPSSTAVVGVAFAFHSLGTELPRRRSMQIGIPVIAVLVAFTAMGAYYVDSVTIGTVIVVLIATLAPLLLGREVNERRRYLTELEERTVRLERDRERRAREAVREERARIARELHDVVAHEMTVMTIQAAAARRVITTDPGQATEALTAIETAGHDALTEMRRLLGLLRHEDGQDALVPQPGLHRLNGLMEQMEESGLPTGLTVEGEPAPLPTGVDLSAYRIIQESLTNSLKHGGPDTHASIRLVYKADEVVIEVADDGRGSAAGLETNGETGHGLVGMRERIAMLDGSLTAGPRAGGGFVVRATIPRSAT
ncbi:MAG: sensor histidine kinase [bacterium]|nr:sensor histidine kinase [bacterium]